MVILLVFDEFVLLRFIQIRQSDVRPSVRPICHISEVCAKTAITTTAIRHALFNPVLEKISFGLGGSPQLP